MLEIFPCVGISRFLILSRSLESSPFSDTNAGFVSMFVTVSFNQKVVNSNFLIAFIFLLRYIP